MVKTTTVSDRLGSPNFRSCQWEQRCQMFSQLLVFNKSNNFTLDNSIRMHPTILMNHYPWHTNQQSRPRVLSHFHQSKGWKFRFSQWSVQIQSSEKMPRTIQMLTRKGGPIVLDKNPTTNFWTATTLIYATGAGITATVGTRLALQLILVKRFKFLRISITRHGCFVLFFLVTTSLFKEWVICALAAFFRSGSRFSGSLSRIEP